MPRDDGFAVADTATGKLDDPKFRKLWRIVHDGPAMNAAVVLHDAVQLASWAAGERVTAEDAAPFWMESVENVAANLQAVGLLDKDGRLPAKAWESWFGAARDRRQKRRDAGQSGGRPKPYANQMVSNANQMVSDAKPLPTSRITTDNPVPSVPSVPLAITATALPKPRAQSPTMNRGSPNPSSTHGTASAPAGNGSRKRGWDGDCSTLRSVPRTMTTHPNVGCCSRCLTPGRMTSCAGSRKRPSR